MDNPTIDKQAIRERIAQLEAERDAFLAQANSRLSAFGGAIEALNGLLADEQSAEVTSDTADSG